MLGIAAYLLLECAAWRDGRSPATNEFHADHRIAFLPLPNARVPEPRAASVDSEAAVALLNLLLDPSQDDGTTRLRWKLAQAFSREPRLKKALEEYAKAPLATRPSPARLLATLEGMPEFSALVAAWEPCLRAGERGREDCPGINAP